MTLVEVVDVDVDIERTDGPHATDAEDDLLGASDQGRKKQIHIVMGLSLLLLSIAAMLLRIDRYDPGKLWAMVIVASLVIVGNIVAIWYLNLTTDFSLLDTEQERIVNGTIRDKYVNAFDEELHKLTQGTYRKVPTGVFIESLEINSFEASLIGRLWMKYPIRNLCLIFDREQTTRHKGVIHEQV